MLAARVNMLRSGSIRIRIEPTIKAVVEGGLNPPPTCLRSYVQTDSLRASVTFTCIESSLVMQIKAALSSDLLSEAQAVS